MGHLPDGYSCGFRRLPSKEAFYIVTISHARRNWRIADMLRPGDIFAYEALPILGGAKHEIDCSAQADGRPKIIKLQRLSHIEKGERNENHQRDDFLNYL